MKSSLRIPFNQQPEQPAVAPVTQAITPPTQKPSPVDFSGGSAKWRFDASSLQNLANWLDNTSSLRKAQCVSDTCVTLYGVIVAALLLLTWCPYCLIQSRAGQAV